MINIPYYSSNFQPNMGPYFQGYKVCKCFWSDIVRAAITVGRAERFDLIRFGRYSIFEWVYRAAIIYSNLSQGDNNYIYRSSAYEALDPSEKGAISYFLGLTAAKLLAEKYLNVEWLMHLDIYRNKLNPSLKKGKIKPDLVGMNIRRDWVILEAKGRSGNLDNNVLKKAKYQTRNLRKIDGKYPILRVALACCFNGDCFEIHWEDPEEYYEDALDLDLPKEHFVIDYYKPFLDLFIPGMIDTDVRVIGNQTFRMAHIDDADMKVGINVALLKTENIANILELLDHFFDVTYDGLDENTSIGGDGILVELGKSWNEEKMKLEPYERAT